MDHSPANLHTQVATQQAVMLPSNQPSEKARPLATVAIAQFPEPKDKQDIAEPAIDQGYDASNIPVQFKPALDFLRTIK